MTVAEEVLPGNMGVAVRVGPTVRRPTGPWTPAVHALLRHLHGRLPGVPRVYGVDDQAREVLDYLPGQVLESVTDAQLVSLVRWMRSFHDAVADFVHPGPWRYFPIAGATLVGHNDIAHYNACFDGDDLVGVFDWDMSGPSNPLMELAFTAWNCVPLWTEIGPAAAAHRLSLIADTYDGVSAHAVLSTVPERIGIMLDGIPVAAAAGDPGMASLMALGEPGRSRLVLDELVLRIPAIAAALPS